LLGTLYRPVAILWDGETTWLRLDGDPDDVDATAVASKLQQVDGPPPLPGPYRWSVPPGELRALRSETAASFVAQIGVGVVHRSERQPHHPTDAAIRQLHDRIKQQFDPSGRMNPGLDPLTVGVGS